MHKDTFYVQRPMHTQRSMQKDQFLGISWCKLFERFAEAADVFRKRCFGNIQQIYRRTPITKRDFKATLLKSRFGVGFLL